MEKEIQGQIEGITNQSPAVVAQDTTLAARQAVMQEADAKPAELRAAQADIIAKELSKDDRNLYPVEQEPVELPDPVIIPEIQNTDSAAARSLYASTIVNEISALQKTALSDSVGTEDRSFPKEQKEAGVDEAAAIVSESAVPVVSAQEEAEERTRVRQAVIDAVKNSDKKTKSEVLSDTILFATLAARAEGEPVPYEILERVPDSMIETVASTKIRAAAEIAEKQAARAAMPFDPFEGFEPTQFAPVVPYPVYRPEGKFTTDTLDANKLAWQIAVGASGKSDRGYIGYYDVPSNPRESLWSIFVHGIAHGVIDTPRSVGKGLTAIGSSVAKATALSAAAIDAGLAAMSGRPVTKWDDSYAKIAYEGIDEFQEMVGTYLDENLDSDWTIGDYEDDSFRHQLGTAFGDAIGRMGTAVISGVPTAAFVAMGFEGQQEMQKNAIDAGLSPLEAFGASAGLSASVGALDAVSNLQMLGIGKALGTGAGASGAKLLKIMRAGKMGARYKSVAARNVLTEIGTELAQTELENVFNPDYAENRANSLLIAFITSGGISTAALPLSLRQAKQEDRAKVAETLNVVDKYNKSVELIKKNINTLIEEGVIKADEADAMFEIIFSQSASYVLDGARKAAMGELDKYTPAEQAEFAKRLERLTPSALSKKSYDAIDSKIDLVIRNSGARLNEQDASLIKGMTRGIANLLAFHSGQDVSVAPVSSIKVSGIPSEPGTTVLGAYSPTEDALTLSSKLILGRVPKRAASDFNSLVRKGFDKSGALGLSRTGRTILHEMAHALDTKLGAGFGDYFDMYMDTIESVFGEGRAEAVQAEIGENGEDRLSSAATIDPKDKSPYTNPKNAPEYFAQAIERLGRRAKETLGLGNSQAAKFSSFANTLMASSVDNKTLTGLTRIAELSKQFAAENSKIFNDIVAEFGSDELNSLLKTFMKTDQSVADVESILQNKGTLQAVNDTMSRLMDETGIKTASTVFDGVSPSSFLDMGQVWFDKAFAENNAIIDENDVLTATENLAESIGADGNAVAAVSVPDADLSAKVTIVEGEGSPSQQARKEAERIINEKNNENKNRMSVKVDGRTIDEDITLTLDALDTRAKVMPGRITRWFLQQKWMWGLDPVLKTLLGEKAYKNLDLAHKYNAKQLFRGKSLDSLMSKLVEKGVVAKDKAESGWSEWNYKLSVDRVKGVHLINPINFREAEASNLTGWQAMTVYLVTKQGEQYKAKLQRGIREDIDAIIATLNESEKKLGDAMSEVLREEYETLVREKFISEEDVEGLVSDTIVNMLTIKDYWPIQSAKHDEYNRRTIDSSRSRHDNDDVIKIEDASKRFSMTVNKIASVRSGLYKTLKRLQDVMSFEINENSKLDLEAQNAASLRSTEVRQAMTKIVGEKGLKNILDTIEHFVSSDANDAVEFTALSKMPANVYKTYLAWKPISLVKNLSNIAGFWSAARNQNVYWGHFVGNMAEPKKTWERAMGIFPEFARRHGKGAIDEYLSADIAGGEAGGILRALNNMDFASDTTGTMAKLATFITSGNKLGLKLFMQTGDAMANVYGGWALYDSYISEGMTHEEAKNKVVRHVLEHQSSDNLMMKPLLQLQANGGIAGQLFAFTSEGVAKWGSMIRMFDAARTGDATAKQAVMNAISTVMTMAIFSLISAQAWDAFDDDEEISAAAEEALYRELIQQVSGATIWGPNIISALVQNAIGDTSASGVSSPLFSYLSEFAKDLREGDLDDLAARSMAASGLMIGAPSIFNGVAGAMQMTSDDSKLRAAGLRRMAGVSEWTANKRTGVSNKKEDKD